VLIEAETKIVGARVKMSSRIQIREKRGDETVSQKGTQIEGKR
jgi:hypothetical protein